MSVDGKRDNIVALLSKRELGMSLFSGRRRLALYSFGEDQTVSRTNKTVRCQLPGSPKSTFLVAFSPDGQTMATTHGDHTVKITDGKTKCCVQELKGHPRTPWSLSFHPSKSNLLASACLGGEVRVWNLNRGDSVVYRSPRSNCVTSIAFHPTDDVLLIATGAQLLFWKWDTPEPVAAIDAPSKLHMVKFDRLGHHILTGIRNVDHSTKQIRNSAVTNSQQNLPRLVTGSSRNNEAARALTLSDSSASYPDSRIQTDMGVLTDQMPSQQLHREHLVTHVNIQDGNDSRSGSLSLQLPEPEISPSVDTQNSEDGFDPHLHQIRVTINHEIAHAFVQRGHVAMATNITNTTHRLQWWDFTKLEMPKLNEVSSRVIVNRCKMHNDASVDMSADGRLLSAYVPSRHGFTVSGNICVFSLEENNLGQCLFSEEFGHNAISVSFSPLGRHLLVGMATRNVPLLFRRHRIEQPIAQILKFDKVSDGSSHSVEGTNKLVASLKYEFRGAGLLSGVSVNTVVWHPVIGSGLVFGTNRGNVYVCTIA